MANGDWGGWWHYYLYGLAIKLPIGTLFMVLVATWMTITNRGPASVRDELFVLAPAIAILVLVSAQTGINVHFRYVLPILPFVFVWVSKLAAGGKDGRIWRRPLCAIAVAWSSGSSLWCYPHTLSYFNELVGGPTGGRYHLLDSSIDWGQDLLYLRKWADTHPGARPLYVAYAGAVEPVRAGIHATAPTSPMSSNEREHDPHEVSQARERASGWYAISANLLHSRHREYADFLEVPPVGRAGYSILIFRVE